VETATTTTTTTNDNNNNNILDAFGNKVLIIYLIEDGNCVNCTTTGLDKTGNGTKGQ
jgi:protein tyrosine/serine phosphatase